MPREIYVMRGGRLVHKRNVAPLSASCAPYVISDDLPDLIHPSNGKRYDSKSRFRAETRARGLTEVGNEQIRDTRHIDMPDMKRSIAQAIEELGG